VRASQHPPCACSSSDPCRPQVGRALSIKSTPQQVGRERPPSSQVKSSHVESSRVMSYRVESSEVMSSGVESSHAMSKSTPSRAEPSRAEPSRVERSRAESSRAESSRVEPSRAESSRVEPSRVELYPQVGRAPSTVVHPCVSRIIAHSQAVTAIYCTRRPSPASSPTQDSHAVSTHGVRAHAHMSSTCRPRMGST